MRQRHCKIVATLGPSSDPPERIQMLIDAGVDCIRINFSHGDAAGHRKRFAAIREVERRADRPITIIADLQGPKIRIGEVAGGEIALRYKQSVTLSARAADGGADAIPLPHPEVFQGLEPGDTLKLDDGKLELTVTSVEGLSAQAEVVAGGVLRSRKGVNIPSRAIPISALTDKDKQDLAVALDAGADYVALSFVQTADDVREARALIGDRAGVLAKIEKPSAVEELDAILAEADALMVARGDLGVELPPELVPVVQRRIIRASRAAGKPVIVATHMLESMVDSPTPTRAEASDVATAVYQGADAVMLSAESAIGRHPATAAAVMDRIIRSVEADPEHWTELPRGGARPETTTADAISLSVRHIVNVLGCSAVVAFTKTGSTAFRMARERPHAKVLALTPRAETARRLTVAWGVQCIVTEDIGSFDEMIVKAERLALESGAGRLNDRIVITAGVPFGRPGKTNVLKISRLREQGAEE